MRAIVNKIIPFSSVDGPGNRTAIFFQGCNLNCIYCHNKETINKCNSCALCTTNCKSSALSVDEDKKVIFDQTACTECDNCINICKSKSSPKAKSMSVDDIINELDKYKMFITGITVSGGECTLNEKFLIELFKRCKEIGLTCLIDTNGTNDFKSMPQLLELCDGVMLDVKSWDDDIYTSYIGDYNNIVKSNLKYLLSVNKLLEVRTVVLTSIFDNNKTVEEVSKVLAKYPSSVQYKLIKFRNHGTSKEIKDMQSPTDDFMQNLSGLAKRFCTNNIIIL